jgi:hypothetical protein
VAVAQECNILTVDEPSMRKQPSTTKEQNQSNQELSTQLQSEGYVVPPVSEREIKSEKPGPSQESSEVTDIGSDIRASKEGRPSVQLDTEWVELRPRWPLTTEKHPSCMPADKLRSAKKARMHASLTEMTTAALEALATGRALQN